MLMVIGMPLLMRLSLPGDMAGNLLIAVFDLRLAWGFWGAWSATLGLAVVSALIALAPRSSRRPAPAIRHASIAKVLKTFRTQLIVCS